MTHLPTTDTQDEELKEELAGVINKTRMGAICDVTDAEWTSDVCMDGDAAVELLLALIHSKQTEARTKQTKRIERHIVKVTHTFGDYDHRHYFKEELKRIELNQKTIEVQL